ncbi:MAG: glycosyltransferase family 39 protein [Phycisphaerae bacterium]|jgi:MFS family permease
MCQQKQSQGLKTAQNTKRFLPWLIVAVIIVITAGIRFRFSDVPLERDEGEYAYAGQLILQGIPPYLHVYNMKLPGIYAAYALILAVLGQTHTAIHIGLLIINAVTILLIFLLTKYLIDSFAGVFAAAAFAVLSLAQSVQGIFANAEHFVILFAVAGILLLVLAVDRNNMALLLASSILLGIGFLMKQHGIAFIVFAGLYLLFSQIRRRPFSLGAFLPRIVLCIIGVILPLGVTCLVLWHAGVFEKFWFWTFVYARKYVSMMPVLDGLGRLKTHVAKIAGSAILIWILAGFGLFTLVKKKEIHNRIPFIVGFLFFSFLSICPGFYFRPHYFILFLPAIALLSGVGLFGIRQVLKDRKTAIGKNLITVLLGLAIIFYTLYQQKNFLLTEDPTAVSRMTYGPNPFPESLKIAEYIKSNSSSGDTIAILGSEPQIFFYADRRSATGYVYTYPLMEPHPYALQMQEEMTQQIEAAKPRFMILVNVPTSWLVRPTSKKLIFDWFNQYHQQYYKPVGVIDIVSMNQTIYRWNENAVGYTPRSKCWLSVFERKNEI